MKLQWAFKALDSNQKHPFSLTAQKGVKLRPDLTADEA